MTSWAPSRFAARSPAWAPWIALWLLAAVAEALALRPVLFEAEGLFRASTSCSRSSAAPSPRSASSRGAAARTAAAAC